MEPSPVTRKVFSLLLSIVFFISFGLIVYFFFKNVELQNELKEQNKIIAKQKNTLTQSKKELADALAQFVIYLKRSKGKINSIVVSDKKLDSLIKKVNNSRYIVGLSWYNGKDDIKKKIVNYLKESNFVVSPPIYNFTDYNGSWMSLGSFVTYYSSNSEQNANIIADDLKKRTNITFKVQLGDPKKAVPKVIVGQEEWTFNIHYIELN